MVTLAPVSLEGVVQRLARARLLLGLLAGLAAACVAEVVGIGVDAQEPDQAVQLTHTILQGRSQFTKMLIAKPDNFYHALRFLLLSLYPLLFFVAKKL